MKKLISALLLFPMLLLGATFPIYMPSTNGNGYGTHSFQNVLQGGFKVADTNQVNAAKKATVGGSLNNYFQSVALGNNPQSGGSQIVTLASGENLIHGLIFVSCIAEGGYHTNYLFASTRTSPGKLIRFNPDDLTSYSVLTFANDGNHDLADDLVYVPSKNKVYVILTRSSDAARIVIEEVNPNTMAATEVVNMNLGSGIGSSITSDGGFLYVTGFGTNSPNLSPVYKFSLASFALTASAYLFDSSSSLYSSAHTIRFDGTNLFVTGNFDPGFIARVSTNDLSAVKYSFTNTFPYVTDDMAIVGDYIYLGSEDSGYEFIFRVKKDFTATTALTAQIYTGSNNISYGTFFDGRYVWECPPGGNPGKIKRIDPNTLEVCTFITGLGAPNEVVSDGQRLFVSSFTSPAKIGRFPMESMHMIDRFFSTTNNSYTSGTYSNGLVDIPNGRFAGDAAGLIAANASLLFGSGTVPAAQMPAFSGDAASSAGSTALTLASVATAGTFGNITFNGKGLVTSGNNNGSNFTNIPGSGLQASSLNSNRFDAATLALFGAGGSGGWTGNPNQFSVSGGATNIKDGALFTNTVSYGDEIFSKNGRSSTISGPDANFGGTVSSTNFVGNGGGLTNLPNTYFEFALGDETTAITTGTAKVTWRAPFLFHINSVRSSLTTVSSSGLPTVNIKDSGTTIFSTKLTIDANELTSTTAATPAVLSDTEIADDAQVTFDIDVAGTGAAGLKVKLYYSR